MKAKNSDWYKHGWDLGIKNMSWVEDTDNQVDFIIRTLGLSGGERVLDLACGYGRHSLSLAKKGYSVVGVDITKDYVDDGNMNAKALGVDAEFFCADIRDVKYENEFDVVLNMADGAIGYLENDEENLKIFDVISRALKSGGKHFMDIGNADHADRYFPKRWWEFGARTLALAEFEWNRETRIMLYGGADIPLGEPLKVPEEFTGDPTRLYGEEEIKGILSQRGMDVKATFCDYSGKPASYRDYQLMVYSQKR